MPSFLAISFNSILVEKATLKFNIKKELQQGIDKELQQGLQGIEQGSIETNMIVKNVRTKYVSRSDS